MIQSQQSEKLEQLEPITLEEPNLEEIHQEQEKQKLPDVRIVLNTNPDTTEVYVDGVSILKYEGKVLKNNSGVTCGKFMSSSYPSGHYLLKLSKKRKEVIILPCDNLSTLMHIITQCKSLEIDICISLRFWNSGIVSDALLYTLNDYDKIYVSWNEEVDEDEGISKRISSMLMYKILQTQSKQGINNQSHIFQRIIQNNILTEKIEKLNYEDYLYFKNSAKIEMSKPSESKEVSFDDFIENNQTKSLEVKDNEHETKWLVEGLIPEGLCFISSDPKNGKTILATTLSYCCQNGIPFFGFPIKNKIDVLYLEVDESKNTLLPKQEKISKQLGVIDQFSLFYEWKKADEGLSYIVYYLKKYPNTKLIIIDTWDKFWSKDENKTSQNQDRFTDRKCLEQFSMINKNYGCSFVFLHHLNKSGSMYGSNVLSGNVDSIIKLELEDYDDSKTGMEITGRLNKDKYLLQHHDGTLSLLGEYSDYSRRLLKDEIFQLILENNNLLQYRDICRFLPEKHAKSISRALRELVTEGRIERTARGVYSLNVVKGGN